MIFLSENKSEKYNECIREFIDQKFYKRLFVSNPSTYFSITFTMKQTLNDMKLDEINFSQDFRHFMNRLNYKISEVPAQWEERSEGSSRFKIFKWLPQYLKWYIYGLATTWLRKKKI